MKVPFNDLFRIHSPLREDFISAFERVLEDGSFILGKEVSTFEESFAKYCGQQGKDYSAGVSNGLSALTLALRAMGIGEGDEVITQANTFNASVSAIRNSCATPVLVDCDKKTGLIDYSHLEEVVTIKTKAIMPVHLYGQQVEIEKISEIADAYNLKIVEDAAQAHGSFRDGLQPGRLGDCATFSFYPGKNLGAFGDGGIVISKNPGLIKKIKELRNYGQTKKYHHDSQGFNERLDSVQASILNLKLPHLDNWNESRRKSSLDLIDRLSGVGDIELPFTKDGNTHTYHLFVIKSGKRDELEKHLNDRGIATGRHYPFPIHLQKAFSYLRRRRGEFPVSEEWSSKGLSLPMFPKMRQDEIDYISDSVRSFFV